MARRMMPWLAGIGAVMGSVGIGGYYFLPVEPGLSAKQRTDVVRLVGLRLNDPYSAVYRYAGWARAPVLRPDGRPELLDPSVKEVPGGAYPVKMRTTDLYCGDVNAKNQFGAYAGREIFLVNPYTGQVYLGPEVDLKVDKADEFASESCRAFLRKL